MSEHYYTRRPSTEHDRKQIQFQCRGLMLQLMTDAGVFSKSGVDFGSRLLVEHLSVNDDDYILDVGCGYGAIGLMCASLIPSGFVTMVDINERALTLAKENAAQNKITNVRVLQSDLYSGLLTERFTKIVSNPPIRAGKQVVHQLFEQSHEWLAPEGQLWIVIQKKQGAPSAIKKLEELFEDVKLIAKDKGYFIVCARQMKEKSLDSL